MIKMLVRNYNKFEMGILMDALMGGYIDLQNNKGCNQNCSNCPNRKVCKDIMEAWIYLNSQLKK